MSLLGGLTDILFGKPKAPKADFAEIEKLMKLETELNRTNQHGIFGGWDWSQGPNGWTQTQSVNPALQPGVDSFMGRVAQGSNSPELQQLMQARFASMMNNQGVRPRPEARPVPQNRGNRSPEDGPPPDWWMR